MELWTAFVLGLVGSLHCAGMCGPLALALPSGPGGTARYVTGRLAYNAGRIVTYCAIGLVFGLLGKSLVIAGVQRWMSIALGVVLIAGVVTSRRFGSTSAVISLVNRLKSAMSAMLRQRSLTALGVLGLLNGLLPCGLVYVAGAGAITTGDPLSGAAFMAAFGLGTVPMLFVIGLSGRLVPPAVRLKLMKAIPISVLLLATLLILRGMALGIPFISPDLTAGDCCGN